MASPAVVDHPNSTSAGAAPSLSQQQNYLDNDDDYFSIDECSTLDRTSAQHHYSNHSTPENRCKNEQTLISNADKNGEECTRLPSVYDNDYENTNSLDGPIQDESSDEESESIGRKRIVQVQQDLDYVNSSDLDCELEIVTKGGVRHLVNTPSDSLRGTEASEPDYVNTDDDNTASSSTQEPDYMNSEELIDTQLFSDNIKLREGSVLSTSIGESMHPLRGEEDTPSQVSCDLLPPGMVPRRFVPMRRCSTLHRESEIKIEKDTRPEEGENLDPTVLNIHERAPGDSEMTTSSANMLLTERVKSSIAPFTMKPSYRGVHPSCNSGPDLSRLGTFERTLLQTCPTSMPNVLQIPWYHEGITRHIAESLLTAKSVPDGTYILRDSLQGGNESLTLSVRCQRTVKHYRILWDGSQFTFGLGKFSDIQTLRDHFDNQPIISGDSGVLVQLTHPYPRSVAEPAIYFDPDTVPPEVPASGAAATTNGERPVTKKWGKKEKGFRTVGQSAPELAVPLLSVNSKEGFLTKLGHHVKNWKKRWFVLYRNELKYFASQGSKDPLRVIHLNDVTAAERDESLGKNYCFKLVTSYRTFFMFGTSDAEANEWVEILTWKLGQRSRSNTRD